MQALSVEINKELKLKEAQKPISKPKSKPRFKSANTKCKYCKYYKEGKDRILFNPKCLVDKDK